MNDLSNTRYRHAQIEGKTIHAEPQGLHKVVAQDFARVDGG
ncbi:MAG TPA: hypothetical protein VHW45_16290 [Candidatus Sulfotelmatobacter sp.]|nr:hypothetical protein [Candidatus Sulfotelmatobacter sp.]